MNTNTTYRCPSCNLTKYCGHTSTDTSTCQCDAANAISWNEATDPIADVQALMNRPSVHAACESFQAFRKSLKKLREATVMFCDPNQKPYIKPSRCYNHSKFSKRGRAYQS